MSAPANLLRHRDAPAKDKTMILSSIDWIWHIRGHIPLAPAQSGEEALDQITPLLRQSGTSHDRQRSTLSFRKVDPEAQDKLAVFDSGILQVEQAASGPVLRYHLISRALLYCFLAPLLFLGFAQLTIALGGPDKAPAKAVSAPHKPKAAAALMNPIDKFLGAPAPEKPDGGEIDEEGPKDKKPSPTAAYVFAGIFAVLYAVGRILEDRLVKSLFQKSLRGA